MKNAQGRRWTMATIGRGFHRIGMRSIESASYGSSFTSCSHSKVGGNRTRRCHVRQFSNLRNCAWWRDRVIAWSGLLRPTSSVGLLHKIHAAIPTLIVFRMEMPNACLITRTRMLPLAHCTTSRRICPHWFWPSALCGQSGNVSNIAELEWVEALMLQYTFQWLQWQKLKSPCGLYLRGNCKPFGSQASRSSSKDRSYWKIQTQKGTVASQWTLKS